MCVSVLARASRNIRWSSASYKIDIMFRVRGSRTVVLCGLHGQIWKKINYKNNNEKRRGGTCRRKRQRSVEIYSFRQNKVTYKVNSPQDVTAALKPCLWYLPGLCTQARGGALGRSRKRHIHSHIYRDSVSDRFKPVLPHGRRDHTWALEARMAEVYVYIYIIYTYTELARAHARIINVIIILGRRKKTQQIE